ncbi:MAG: RhsIA family immunity protein [Acetatifactor sp.]|nr:RhsIA family immunity protein [Acetatifactor sp.]
MQVYQDYRIVDAEQINRKKLYVYCEKDDVGLSQYRYLVVLTDDGWKIDKSEWLFDGRWSFYPLK